MDGGCPTNSATDTIDWIGGGVADQTSGIVQSTVGGNSLRLPNGSDEFDALMHPRRNPQHRGSPFAPAAEYRGARIAPFVDSAAVVIMLRFWRNPLGLRAAPVCLCSVDSRKESHPSSTICPRDLFDRVGLSSDDEQI